MAKDLRIVRRAFNAGEVSPQLAYRNDTEKHAFACSKLENFYVSPIGAISRRLGTRLLGLLGSVANADNVRLIPFEYNRELSYVLAFHTQSDSNTHSWRYSSDPFHLHTFSICFKIPENFQKTVQISGMKIADIAGFTPDVTTIGFKITTDRAHGLSDGSQVKFYNATAQFRFTVVLSSSFEDRTSVLKSGVEYPIKVLDETSFLINAAKYEGMIPESRNFSSSCPNGYFTSDSLAADNTSLAEFDTATILNKGNFSLDFDSASRKLKITDANLTLETSALSRDAHDIILTYAGGRTRIFDGKTMILESTALSFNDDGLGLDFFAGSSFGDMWSLKVFDYDLMRSDVYYCADDFVAGKDETTLMRAALSFENQTSLYGSRYENGKFVYNWESATNTRRAEIMAHYHTYDQTIQSAKFDVRESQLLINSLNTSISDLQNLIQEYESGGSQITEGDYNHYKEQLQTEQTQLAEEKIRLIPLKESLMATWAEAFGYATWEKFFEYSQYTDEDSLYAACWSESFVPPVRSVCEVITAPFLAPAGGNIEYTQYECKNVTAALDGSPVVSGAIATTKRNFTLSFSLNEDDTIPGKADPERAKLWSGSLEAWQRSILQETPASWHSDKVVKLTAFDVNGNKVCDSLSTSIPAEILNNFQYKQVCGYLFVAHSQISPKRFAFDGKTFVCSEAVNFQPSQDTKEEDLTLTLAGGSGLKMTGDGGQITANRAFFTPDMIGQQLKVEYSDSAFGEYKWRFDSTGKTSAWVAPCGKITLRPQGGVWDGVLLLEESTDCGKSWAEIGRTTSVQGSDNATIEREVYDANSIVRARMKSMGKVEETSSTKVEAATEGCFFNLYASASSAVWLEIAAVNNEKSATVKFLNPCRANWESSAVYSSTWGGIFGYPRTVDMHEERLVFGGTAGMPSTVWLSQTNNWDNFRSVANLDTDPLSYTLASDDGEPICWLVSRSDLMIGLGNSEWSLGSRDATQSLSAKIVRASNQSQDGVEYIMPAKAANMVVYVRRGNRELGCISYDFASDAYNSISLTTMCPEILNGGVKELFNQLSPKNYIWAIRNDGVCSIFTYDRENNVSAWARFSFGDGVVSACALSSGPYRSVFMIVKRNGFLCLERLDPNEANTDNWLDCVPISENVEVPEGLSTGVRYTSQMETTPIFLEGHIKVLCAEFIMLNSYGGQFRLKGFNCAGEPLEDDSHWRNLAIKSSNIEHDPIPRDYRFTGNCQSGYLEECSIEIKTDERAPFTLCAIALKAGEI